jgi:uncharacterized membrane protein
LSVRALAAIIAPGHGGILPDGPEAGQMNTTIILLRVVHILSGVFWGGAVLFLGFFLLPSIGAAGPAGPKVMRQLIVVRKFPRFIGIFAMLTVLSGLWMFGRINSASGGAFARSTQGMVYGVGAIFAIVTVIIALSVAAPTGAKIIALGDQVEAGGGTPTPEQAATLAALGKRMLIGARVAAINIVIAALAMAAARYL